MNKISLVVLTYNGWEYTHNLLLDIRRYCSSAYEIVIVDNGSQDSHVKQGLEFWQGISTIPLDVVQIQVNLGFIHGMNRGIKKATGDVVVALSNDVRILSEQFLLEIDQEFTKDNEIVLGGTLYTTDTGWNKFGEKIIPYVEGWCIACHKYMWNTLGLFNPMYSPSDYEDVEFSYKAVMNGAKLQQLTPGLVHHLGAKTFGYNPERLERTKRNRKLFAEKWGFSDE